MNETNKFKDDSGDSIQAVMTIDGSIIIHTNGEPKLDCNQVDEFIHQLAELSKEARS